MSDAAPDLARADRPDVAGGSAESRVATTADDGPTRVHDRPAADDPLTAERGEHADTGERRRFGLRRRRPVAANPEQRDEV